MTQPLDPHALVTVRQFIEATEPDVLDLMLEPGAPNAFQVEESRAAKVAARYGLVMGEDGKLPMWVFETAVG